MDGETLVVNLWAGPGTGKSTNAALVFGKLKTAGINCELVHEYAKDLVWEERYQILSESQIYIVAKQQRHIERVQGKVEVIITDSPLPFGLIYGGRDFTEGLRMHIVEIFGRWRNLNIFLQRDNNHHPYEQTGRMQNLSEAEELDWKIRDLVMELDPKFLPLHVCEEEITANTITDLVLAELKSGR